VDPRLVENKKWLIGAGAVAFAFLFLRSSCSRPSSDLDALTQMLLTETDFAHSKEEMAQIVFVALNRAKRWGVTPTQVVYPPGSPGVWNGASGYRDRFCRMPKHPRWEAARDFVQSVLNGAYANRGWTSFLHPGGMSEPPCSSSRTAVSTISGTRCLPQWAVNGTVVGQAMFA
jgi:hypothetical protein